MLHDFWSLLYLKADTSKKKRQESEDAARREMRMNRKETRRSKGTKGKKDVGGGRVGI